MKKLLSVFLCLLIAGAVFVGCEEQKDSSAEQTKSDFKPRLDQNMTGELKIGGLYENFEALEAVFKELKTYYPNLTTNYFHIDNYSQAIDKTVVGGDAPDVLFIKSYTFDYPDEYKNVQETALELDDSSLDISLDNINDSFIRHTSDGKMVFFPAYMFTFGMIVNEKILSDNGIEMPTTYSEFLSVCEKLKNSGYEKPVVGYLGNTDLYSLPKSVSFGYLLNSVYGNKEACRAINERTEDADTYIRSTLEFVKDFYDTGYVDEEISSSFEDHYNEVIMRFFEGDIPFVLTGNETVTGMPKRESKSEAYTNAPFDYSFTVFPYDENGGTMPIYADYGFVVNKNSANKDIAVEFLRLLSQKNILDEFCDIKSALRISKGAEQVNHLKPLNAYMDRVQLYGSESITQNETSAWSNAVNGFWSDRDIDKAIKLFHEYQAE